MESGVIKEIISKLLEHSERLLDEYGEFYPFSFVRNLDKSVVLLNVYSGQDYPNATEHLEQLESKLQEEYSTYGIAINSLIKNELQESMSIILIKLCIEGQDYEDSYVPYNLKSGLVELGDLTTFSDPS